MPTVAQAAQHLEISQSKVYQLAKAGQLACYRFGSSLRFDQADLDAYKQQCRSPAITQAAGCTSLTASSPVPGAHALTAYFQKAGRNPKPRLTTAPRAPASRPLRLVSASQPSP